MFSVVWNSQGDGEGYESKRRIIRDVESEREKGR
jgi:hypothetical protein